MFVLAGPKKRNEWEREGAVIIREKNMKVLSRSLLLALVFGGSIATATATASSVITDVAASGAGLGSFSVDRNGIVDGLSRLDLSKTFASVNPIALTFTVAHSEAAGTPYDVYEAITNGTTSTFAGT